MTPFLGRSIDQVGVAAGIPLHEASNERPKKGVHRRIAPPNQIKMAV
jgi:hypothetical protein